MTLDLDGSADAQRLTAVFSDVLQKIMLDTETGWGNDAGLQDKWFRILREDGFDVRITCPGPPTALTQILGSL